MYTQRDRRKKKSRRHRELISTVLENIPAMVTFFDPSGKVRYVNRFFTLRTGWSLDMVGDKDLLQVCYPDTVIRKEAVAYMLSGLPGWKSFPIHTMDEKVIHSSWANVKLSDGSYVGIGIDMTKELLIEERIRNLALQISKTAEIDQQKIAGALHDQLIQPLASMKLSLESLRLETDIEGTVESRLEDVLRAMGELLLDMRKISHELYPPVLTHLGIDEVIHSLAERLREQYEFHLTVETAGNFPQLDTDRKYFIYMAVHELVLNITKHAEAKNVRLFQRADPGEITIIVEDDGRGFDQTLFESLSHREDGFGLLRIRMRLEEYGGVLAIRSNPGTGTAISIKIPVSDSTGSVES